MIRRILSIFLFLILLLAFHPAGRCEEGSGPDPEAELLRLHQINIGSGDAYLLTVGDLVILVDCGTNITVPIANHAGNPPLFNYLAASGIDHVDVHFVTHWHNDHCYNVDTLSELYGTDDTIVYGASPNLLKDLDPLPHGTYVQLKDGDQLTIGPLDVLCVSPPYKEEGLGALNNNQSLNFIVTYKDIRIMFTGDYMDWTLLRRWGLTLLDIDILSFPHHGINNPIAVTKEVYQIVNPYLVLVPGGERGVVRKIANEARARTDPVVYCTKDGNILATTDGSDIWVATQVKEGTFPLGEKLPPRNYHLYRK